MAHLPTPASRRRGLRYWSESTRYAPSASRAGLAELSHTRACERPPTDGLLVESEDATYPTMSVIPVSGVVSASLVPAESLSLSREVTCDGIPDVIVEVGLFAVSSEPSTTSFSRAYLPCLVPRWVEVLTALVLRQPDNDEVAPPANSDPDPDAELRCERAVITAWPSLALASGLAASVECAFVESAGAAAATP